MESLRFNHLLFVYGLLRSGSNHRMSHFLKENATFICRGYLHGHLFLVEDYPGVRLEKTTDRVVGDIFGFDDDQLLGTLDDFEEIEQTDEYIRTRIQVYAQSGPLSCWTYLYNRPTQHLPLITSGDFLKYLNEN